MTLRGLGIFFLLVGIAFAGFGCLKLNPDKLESFLLQHTNEQEKREKEIADLDEQIRLDYQRQGRAHTPAAPLNYAAKSRAEWMQKKDERESARNLGFGIGGALLVIGLICIAAAPKSPSNHAH